LKRGEKGTIFFLNEKTRSLLQKKKKGSPFMDGDPMSSKDLVGEVLSTKGTWAHNSVQEEGKKKSGVLPTNFPYGKKNKGSPQRQAPNKPPAGGETWPERPVFRRKKEGIPGEKIHDGVEPYPPGKKNNEGVWRGSFRGVRLESPQQKKKKKPFSAGGESFCSMRQEDLAGGKRKNKTMSESSRKKKKTLVGKGGEKLFKAEEGGGQNCAVLASAVVYESI